MSSWKRRDLERLARFDEGVWLRFLGLLESLARSVGRRLRLRASERDEIYEAVLLAAVRDSRAFADGCKRPDRFPAYLRTRLARSGAKVTRRAAARRPVESSALGEGWSAVIDKEAQARGREFPSGPGAADLERMLARLKERLSGPQADVVALRLRNLTWQEIGARTGRSRDAVRKLFQRAVDAAGREDSGR